MTENVSPVNEVLIAKPGRYYRNARYTIVAMALIAGLWTAYDGFYNWPNYRDQFNKMDALVQAKLEKPHSDFDIKLQQYLAVALLSAAPVLLTYFLYRSRGEYRMTSNTLSVPGHKPITFDRIISLDLNKWDRKGIAYVIYKLPASGKTGRATLDDFIYDQDPTDLMVKRIENMLRTEVAEEEPQPAPEHKVRGKA